MNGCGNHNCVIKRPNHGTNGPCSCPRWKLEARIKQMAIKLQELYDYTEEPSPPDKKDAWSNAMTDTWNILKNYKATEPET